MSLGLSRDEYVEIVLLCCAKCRFPVASVEFEPLDPTHLIYKVCNSSCADAAYRARVKHLIVWEKGGSGPVSKENSRAILLIHGPASTAPFIFTSAISLPSFHIFVRCPTKLNRAPLCQQYTEVWRICQGRIK